jgi:hypothetical protein
MVEKKDPLASMLPKIKSIWKEKEEKIRFPIFLRVFTIE